MKLVKPLLITHWDFLVKGSLQVTQSVCVAPASNSTACRMLDTSWDGRNCSSGQNIFSWLCLLFTRVLFLFAFFFSSPVALSSFDMLVIFTSPVFHSLPLCWHSVTGAGRCLVSKQWDSEGFGSSGSREHVCGRTSSSCLIRESFDWPSSVQKI